MPDLPSMGKWVFLAGLALVGLGGLIWLAGRFGVPLGRLPGDFRFSAGGATCFVPLATSLVLSFVLTVLLNLILRGPGK